MDVAGRSSMGSEVMAIKIANPRAWNTYPADSFDQLGNHSGFPPLNRRIRKVVLFGHLPFNRNGIGGTLGLAGLADEAVLHMNRNGFLFSTHLLHLIDHKRACPKASPATDALFPADGNLLADDLFPLLI